MIQSTTVGTVVLFYPNETDAKRLSADANHHKPFEPVAAVVVRQWGPDFDSACNLLVLRDGATPVWVTSVRGARSGDVPSVVVDGVFGGDVTDAATYSVDHRGGGSFFCWRAS